MQRSRITLTCPDCNLANTIHSVTTRPTAWTPARCKAFQIPPGCAFTKVTSASCLWILGLQHGSLSVPFVTWKGYRTCSLGNSVSGFSSLSSYAHPACGIESFGYCSSAAQGKCIRLILLGGGSSYSRTPLYILGFASAWLQKSCFVLIGMASNQCMGDGSHLLCWLFCEYSMPFYLFRYFKCSLVVFCGFLASSFYSC